MRTAITTCVAVVVTLVQALMLIAHGAEPARDRHRHAICVTFSPDGAVMASGSTDRTITLWDARTVKATMVLEGHTGAVTTLAFSPDGKTLASSSTDETLRIWDVRTGRATETRHTPMGECHAVWYRPNGELLATAIKRGALSVWDGEAGHAARTLVTPKKYDHVCDVALTSDGKTLVSLDWEGTFRLWDAATGQSLSKSHGGPTQACCISVSATGRTISVGTNSDGAHWLVDLPDTAGTMLADYGDAVEDVQSTSFSPDGKLLAVAVGGAVELWNVADRSRIATYYEALAYDIAFSPDGTKLVAAKWIGKDGRELKAWDMSKGLTAP